MRTSRELERLRRAVEVVPTWYHRIDLGDGVVTPGPYDMAPHVASYGLPADMRGLRVLDVGPGNGFFSFEFERRGASAVVALDLPSWEAHDWGLAYRNELAEYSAEERARYAETCMRAPFELVRRELGSSVERFEGSVYELSREALGLFDLVFCASVLMHLRDPVLALERMRSVCTPGATLVVSTATAEEDREEPLATFVAEERQCNYWVMNPACLRRMLTFCGFEPTGWEARYVLRSGDFEEPRFVCHALAPSGAPASPRSSRSSGS